MNRQSFILSIALALSLSTIMLGAVAQTAAPAKAKVVFQVSDGDAVKWNLALNNAKNVQQELGEDKVSIEIVAYGPGIGMLKADAVTSNRVEEATKSGIQVVACENTMRGQKLTKADMNPAVGFVPAGVVELIKRQGEGWAYIRP
jgi:intracellular sulfur oxidation DsrE/DsrF family protein